MGSQIKVTGIFFLNLVCYPSGLGENGGNNIEVVTIQNFRGRWALALPQHYEKIFFSKANDAVCHSIAILMLINNLNRTYV